jgi:hypothetical protein
LLAATDSARGHFRYGFPHVLPGGRAALITVWMGRPTLDSTFLGVITIPDGKVTELGIRGTNPHYSGTGHIVYANADAWLFAVPFSERSLRVTGPPYPVAEGVAMGRGGAAGFAVARNGTLVYRSGSVGGATGLSELVGVTRDGIERPLATQVGRYGNPRVSPDGRQIAFQIAVGGRGNSLPDIWRFDTASKASTRVTADSTSVYPSWSHDGERIAYTRLGGDSVVVWQPLYQNAQPVPLLQMKRPTRAFSLARPGAYAAFRVSEPNSNSYDIWLVHMDSLSSPRPFLAEEYSEHSPEMSPDGRLIAYVTNRTGANEVYVRRVPSGADEVLVSLNGGLEPIWSPDGRELFYRGRGQFMVARLSDGPRLTVTRRDTLFPDVYVRNQIRSNYDVFPDGRTLVVVKPVRVTANNERSRLVVLMNWHLRNRARYEFSER